MPASVFISYGRRDQEPISWLERVNRFLEFFERRGRVDVWHDGRIVPGRDWHAEIRESLERVNVAILLVGPSFLASEFIALHELRPLLEAARSRGVRIFPVITHYCAYEESELAPFQAFNSPRQPLEALPEAEQNRLLNELSLAVARELDTPEVKTEEHNSPDESIEHAELSPVPSRTESDADLDTTPAALPLQDPQPLARPYVALAAGSFAAVTALLYFLAVRVEDIDPGVFDTVRFVALLLSGLGAAAFLFGAMRSYARWRGVLLSGSLELGGPAVLALLVVASGFLMPGLSRGDFTITVRVFDPAGEAGRVTTGVVVLYVGDCSAREELNDRGEAHFRNLAQRCRGKRALVGLTSDRYALKEPGKQYEPQSVLEVETVSLEEAAPVGLVPRAGVVPPPAPEKIREVATLPQPDYGKIEFDSVETVVDFRSWKPLPDDPRQGRVSPVTWTRRIRLRKAESVDQLRFRVSTEGSAVDAGCASGQPYHIEFAPRPGTPATVLLTAYDVIVDVAKYRVGEVFDVVLEATLWNGSKEDEDWYAFVIHAPTPQISAQLLFPPEKPFRQFKLVLYEPGGKEELDPPEEGSTVLPQENRQRLFWEIQNPLVHHTYEVQWTW